MISFVILFTILLLALVEIISRREDLIHLQVRSALDSDLVALGDIITLRYTVSNTSVFPLLYAGLTVCLNGEYELREDEKFRRTHVTEDFFVTRITHHFYLGPRRQFSGKLRFSVKNRGYHELGKYYLESGDFLGLKPVLRTGMMGVHIICTAATCDIPHIHALGGEMGNVSVQRFIQDDPTMILGYREYTGHEPMKQISWNQTAKTGQLIVRQNDFTADRIAEVLVNIDPTSRSLMERCLSLTTSVCLLLEREKIPYSMKSNGDLFSLKPGLGMGHLFFIQKRIGLSRLTGYIGFPSLVNQCLLHRKPNCTYIVITPTLDDDCRIALGRLARHVDLAPVVLCAEEDYS